MVRHEQIEEICAAACVGQASPEELYQLEEHAALCEGCAQKYLAYLDFAAGRLTEPGRITPLSPQGAEKGLDSDLMVRRFYMRAEREGILFSRDVVRGSDAARPAPIPFQRRLTFRKGLLAAAATVIVGVALSLAYRDLLPNRASGGAQNSASAAYETQIADLRSASLRLQAELDRARAEATASQADQARLQQINPTTEAQRVEIERQLAESRIREHGAQLELAKLRASTKEAAAALATGQATIKDLSQRLSEAQGQLGDLNAVAETARLDAAGLRQRAAAAEAAMAANQVRIADLARDLEEKTASLERERQLLALGRDVTDLMGARNLHVVDVVDTDARGQDRRAFGRIFFTEDKSLVFYAYDLNEARLQKASYEYRVWARKEGRPQEDRSLGIFYSDNKAQRRWVFKFNDPKILSEIDSVFVTLEPSNRDSRTPNGAKMMYAYLRGQPNHQ